MHQRDSPSLRLQMSMPYESALARPVTKWGGGSWLETHSVQVIRRPHTRMESAPPFTQPKDEARYDNKIASSFKRTPSTNRCIIM